MHLGTKLIAPAATAELVSRPRLTEALRQQGRRLTLLSAPAGSGKTTLLAEWIDRTRPSVAWVSLDRRDNAPDRFLGHLVAALLKARPELAAPEGLGDPTRNYGPVDPAQLERLLDRLVDLDEPLTLVLDDYHFIEDDTIHELVELVLEHQPECLHVVVSSRTDPPLPLSRLRVRRRLQEIRAADLRFTVGEASEMLSQLLGTSLRPFDIEALCQRTEGWAAGLQLAGLSLRGSDDPGRAISSFSGDHRYIVDYLTDEVLSGLDEPIRDFLLETSILEVLTPPLCEVVTGRPGSADMLERLERSNLFVVALDEQRQWFRYHHLFADLLRSRLMRRRRPEDVAGCLMTASRWYTERDEPDLAIDYATSALTLETDDATARQVVDLIVPLIEHHGQRLFGQARRFQVEGWLDRLPERIKRERPRLGLLTAKVLIINQRRDEAEAYLQSVEEVLSTAAGMDDGAKHALHGEVAVARASLAVRRWDMSDAIEQADRALTELPHDALFDRAHAHLSLGLAERWQGHADAAREALQHAVDEAGRCGDPLITVCAWTGLARLALDRCELQTAEALCRHGLELSRDRGWDRFPAQIFLRATLGEILWERGEPTAQEVLESGLAGGGSKHRRSARPIRQEARDVTRRLLDLVRPESPNRSPDPPATVPAGSRVLPILEPLDISEARVCLARGEVAAVRSWLDREGITADDAFVAGLAGRYLVLARVLLAEGSLEAARRLLARLLAEMERAGLIRLVIEGHALMALVRRHQGAAAKATESMRQALALAAPENAIRTFREIGPALWPLLDARAEEYPDLVSRLRETLSIPTGAENPGWVEPLSEREREVLELVVGGLSNREIAERLFLSPNTIKTHIRNLYGKIGAKNRAQAIARSRELSLL